jgi:hypothetical protein
LPPPLPPRLDLSSQRLRSEARLNVVSLFCEARVSAPGYLVWPGTFLSLWSAGITGVHSHTCPPLQCFHRPFPSWQSEQQMETLHGRDFLLFSVISPESRTGPNTCPHSRLSVSRPWINNQNQAGHRWLTPVILATQEAAIRRIVVQSQPGQIVL